MVFVFDTELLNDTAVNLYYKINDSNTKKIISNKELLNKNEYYKESLSSYFKDYDEFVVHNKEELMNAYYTAINNGYEGLTFYCDKSYTDCSNDINILDNDEEFFSYINQLVHVYNSYETIKSTYSSNLRVDITIERKYNKSDIEKIDNELMRLIEILNINNFSSVDEKIKAFHDYLANSNTYDQVRADTGTSDYNSDTAIGTLFQGKSICSGYTDAMALFLDKLNLTNTRIASDKHVWNAVLINGEWKHIDLTWDDPIVSDGSNVVLYNYFLIDTDTLSTRKDTEHDINKTVYDFIK